MNRNYNKEPSQTQIEQKINMGSADIPHAFSRPALHWKQQFDSSHFTENNIYFKCFHFFYFNK